MSAFALKPTIAEMPAVCRNTVATPDTATARANESALLRACQDAGYRRVSEACGHDKSWLSRWFQDEARATKSEILAMLDSTALTVGEAKEGADEDLLIALLHTTEAGVRRSMGEVPDSTSVTISSSEYRALLTLAHRQLEDMKARGSK